MTKIVSWNVNSIRVRLPHLVQLKETIDPDVIMLQETKSTDENFPFDDIKEMGFEIITKGQKSYNGVAILSKVEFTDCKYINFCKKNDTRHVSVLLNRFTNLL